MEIERIISFEREYSPSEGIEALSPDLRRMYAKIELSRRNIELSESVKDESGKKESLARSMDSDVDMSLSL